MRGFDRTNNDKGYLIDFITRCLASISWRGLYTIALMCDKLI